MKTVILMSVFLLVFCMLSGSVPAATGVQDGATLLKNKCSLCHTLDRILSAEEPPVGGWALLVQRERERAAFLMSQAEADTIAQYLERREMILVGGEEALIAPTARVVRNIVFEPAGKLNASISDPRFITGEAMYAANEFILAGIPFFESVITMDLTGVDVTALASLTLEDANWFSRHNLSNIAIQSGMGLHLVRAPGIEAEAIEENITPQAYLDQLVARILERTGKEEALPGMYPIFAEFASGEPFLLQLPDYADYKTLRQNPTKFDKTLEMSALGQTLANQVLWAKYLFGSNHPSDRPIFLGNNADEGFLGAILSLEAIHKMLFLQLAAAYDGTDLGSVSPDAYEAKIKYYPHKIAVRLTYGKEGEPPSPSYTVVDASSKLFDQASLLWGTSEFYHFSDPKIEDNWDSIFGPMARGALFPSARHDLAKGLSAVIIKNMIAMHFRPMVFSRADRTWIGTFVSSNEDGRKGSVVETVDAGMALTALANAHARFHDVEDIRRGIKSLVTEQATFLSERLQAPDGGFYRAYDVDLHKVNSRPRTLASQAFAIRGLMAAYKVTENRRFFDSAMSSYHYMEQELWSPTVGLYRSQEKTDLSVYTPLNVGATIGALREIVLERKDMGALDRLQTFFINIVKKNGLQLAELEQTGETMASVKDIMTPDADNDGVKKPPFGGGKFGTAPVLASEARVATP